MFCNVKRDCVIENCDVPLLYEAPLVLEEEGLASIVCREFGLEDLTPDLTEWTGMVEDLRHPQRTVTIALVGKYVELHDAYLSVAEALKHGGIPTRTAVDIRWIDAEVLADDNVGEMLADVDGVLVPGGFGTRGIDGKIAAARFARERGIPFLGICLGMQIAVVEFARHVLGYEDAHSTEIDPTTTHGDIRSKAYAAYGEELIYERHRHRYEFNNDFRQVMEENGMLLAGISPDKHIVEMVELPDHPWFVACQFHPEFKSRPNRAHPLFREFIGAAKKYGGTIAL